MAINPIIHNDGGVNRFLDYLSTVPEFLKVEDDVVSMLQLFSDYINNAYRNTTIVDKFSFKLIATDNNVVAVQNEMSRLVNLFRQTESRGLKMLYISKPQGNPRAGTEGPNPLDPNWPLYRERIQYNGTIDALGVTVMTIPNPEDGDKFFIEFTRGGQESNTGVYVFNQVRNVLQLDPMGASQDPFNSTVNTPSFTNVGLAPRMLEFSIADTTNVKARRAAREGTITYYEVFFEATIYNIEDVSSILTKTINNNGTNNQDFNYVIDYYDVLDNIPSSYSFKFDIEFGDACKTMNWGYSEITQEYSTPGLSLFYARDLTDIDPATTLINREGRNIYVDPSFSLNTSANDVVSIVGSNGIDVTVTTRHRHSLSEDDKISIFGTVNFDGNYTVSKVIGYNTFRFSDATINSETIGRVVTRNLFYSKSIDDPNTFQLVVPYIGLDGTREFEESDFIVRIEPDITPITTTFNAVNVDILNNTLKINSLDGFPEVRLGQSISVVIYGDGTGTIPLGITEGVVYDMFIHNPEQLIVSFSGINITSVGSGNFSIRYEGDSRLYFDTSVGVNLVDNTLILNGVDGLEVGSNIFFRELSPNIILPSPLKTLKAYQVSEIDELTNEVMLDGITLSGIGSGGVTEFSVIVPVSGDNGRVDSIIIDNPLTTNIDGSGRIILKTYTGDMISSGLFGRYQNNKLVAFAQYNTTASVWSDDTYPLYHSGDLVVYNEIQYKVIPSSLQITINSSTPPEEVENYQPYMDEIITRPDIYISNPYMFGLYRGYSQGFDETIDYTQSYSQLGSEMYIQQIEDLALRYGFDQRQWIFNPRRAPQSSVIRNGFLDFVENSLELYDPVNNNNVALSISKANTVENNPLFGVNTPIIRTINTLTSVGGIVSVATVGVHGYKSGNAITIQGSDITETNGSFVISVTSETTFTYSITNVNPLTAGGTITSIYQPNVSDFINVISQDISSENGIYIVMVGTWVKYDDSKLLDPSIVFCKQNLFTTGELNPSIARGDLLEVNLLNFIGTGIVQVTTSVPHEYEVNTTFEIRDAVQVDYNGRFEVEMVIDDYTFQYHIGDALTPTSPAIGNITCQSDVWYQYRIGEIQWQKVSKLTESDFENEDGTPPIVIPFDDGNNNVNLLEGIYPFTLANGIVINFTNNLIVSLEDQLIVAENGIYRIQSDGIWTRLDTKMSMKVRDMRINAYDNQDFIGLELDEEAVIYRTFTDTEVSQYINSNISSKLMVYKVSYPFVQDFEFIFEKVDEIDTVSSLDREYDARQDYNSVVDTSDMDSNFTGIPDMDYPLVEKIERIAYNKDPRVIDIDLIGYLARYMGYDITNWVEDITSSPYYNTPQEVENAIRRAVEQLPQYYTLKSTKSGLELLLLIFGIVGELVTKWTPQDSPYSEFIPDYQIRGREYADMSAGINRSYVPTPHFEINVNIAGNFENQILQSDGRRVIDAIKRFKPINTVFDGIKQYIKAKQMARITISKMNATGKQSCSIGFETLDWNDDLIDNDCL